MRFSPGVTLRLCALVAKKRYFGLMVSDEKYKYSTLE